MTVLEDIFGPSRMPPADFSIEELAGTLEPVAGDNVIGSLDNGLITAYAELANVELELEAISEDLRKRLVTRQAHQVADTVNQYEFHDGYDTLINRVNSLSLFTSEEDADHMLRTVARWNELNHSFWYRLRLTFNSWNSMLSIRAGWVVVCTGKKYKI